MVKTTSDFCSAIAGGFDGQRYLDIVEVMNIPDRQWATASHLPHPFGGISGTICGGKLYLAGGFVRQSEPPKLVLTCSVTDLLPASQEDKHIWHSAKDLPVIFILLVATC